MKEIRKAFQKMRQRATKDADWQLLDSFSDQARLDV